MEKEISNNHDFVTFYYVDAKIPYWYYTQFLSVQNEVYSNIRNRLSMQLHGRYYEDLEVGKRNEIQREIRVLTVRVNDVEIIKVKNGL